MRTKPVKTIWLSIIIVLFLALPSTISAQSIKIAVPATGSEKESLICKETGRAPFFLFFDGQGNFIGSIKNPAEYQTGGISRTVVALFVDNDITVVVTQTIGNKMKLALTDHHIAFVEKTGVVNDAVQSFIHDQDSLNN